MKITLITAYFPPEVGSASHLFFELGRELTQRGHHVTVLTGFPKYHVEKSKVNSELKKSIWVKEKMENMDVIRIRTLDMPRQIPIFRGLDQLTSSIMFFFFGLFLNNNRPDIILVYSPPLFLGITAFFLRLIKKGKFVLNVQDLFPQSAIDLGLLKNKLLIKLFRIIESILYRKADAVTVHSSGNKVHVINCGGNQNHIHIVHNPVDTKFIVPGNRNNEFRHRYDIPEIKFVVSFAGVIGYSQDLDTVIDAAKFLREYKDIEFYIVGDGVEKQRLIEMAKDLKNVKFLPMLPKDEYLELLHASDLCLVTLRSEVKTPVVPSKILSIMAAGRPVVACLPLEGDAPIIIKDANCGICLEPDNPVKLSEAIAEIYKNRESVNKYSVNGRKYAEDNFSLETCTSTYENIFNNLINR
ncbi:MAG: glycosyltransferase WbuB [Flavobacterium sp.]|nr:glycosyltransferase WbuB [Flavobacterium sp.]